MGRIVTTGLGALAVYSQLTFASSFFETLRAADLIGSHFGIPGFNASFDYVIVGGGTAGLALAYRLAEDARYTVAVVEAGGFYEMDNGNWSSIPGQVGHFIGSDPLNNNPLIDWEQYTTAQAVSDARAWHVMSTLTSRKGAGDRKILYTRGKTLGGSSARNYMAYQR